MENPILIGITMAALGWASNSILTSRDIATEFREHKVADGHPETIKSLASTAVVLERLVVEVSHLGAQQSETRATIDKMAENRRQDMREVRKALRIPDR